MKWNEINSLGGHPKSKKSDKSIDWFDWLIDFLKIDIVCAARENERVCRYVKKKVYFTRTENLNCRASIYVRVLRNERITTTKRYRLDEARTHA